MPTATPLRADRQALEAAMARKRYDFEYSAPWSIAAAGGNTSIEIKTQQDSFFVCQTIAGLQTSGLGSGPGNVKLRLRDDGTGQSWTSDYVRSANLFGTAQRPNILLTPLVVPPTATIIADLVDMSVAINNAGELVFGGYKVFAREMPEMRGSRPDQWFQYVVTKDVGALSADTLSIKLSADAHFEVHKMTAVSGVAGGPMQTPTSFTARVTDSGTGKSWSDRLLRAENMFGVAQYPRVLPFPKLLDPSTTVVIDVVNLLGAVHTIEIVLEGAKRFVV